MPSGLVDGQCPTDYSGANQGMKRAALKYVLGIIHRPLRTPWANRAYLCTDNGSRQVIRAFLTMVRAAENAAAQQVSRTALQLRQPYGTALSSQASE